MKNFRNIISFLLFVLVTSRFVAQNVGINTTTPDGSAALEVSSDNGGILIPRLTEVERDAILNPATGLLIFQIDQSPGFYFYTGTAWTGFGGQGWDLGGQTGTDSTIHFIGTTDTEDFSIGTNNTETLRASTSSNLGIGELNPTAKLHISGNAPLLRYQDGNEANNAFLTSDALGNSRWGQFVSSSGGNDEDWLFESGSSTADPIYHEGGGVVIGRTGTTIFNLDIDNGTPEGSTFAIGNEEFIRDGNNETQFSHALVPSITQGNTTPIDLGDSTHLWNTIYAVNGTIQTSDGSLKKNINSLGYDTKTLMELRPVSYLWKEENRNGIKIPKEQREVKLGFIAQEIQEIIPEVVKSTSIVSKDGLENNVYENIASKFLGMNYDELIPLLVKVKQEQHQRILTLLQENKKLIEDLKN